MKGSSRPNASCETLKCQDSTEFHFFCMLLGQLFVEYTSSQHCSKGALKGCDRFIPRMFLIHGKKPSCYGLDRDDVEYVNLILDLCCKASPSCLDFDSCPTARHQRKSLPHLVAPNDTLNRNGIMYHRQERVPLCEPSPHPLNMQCRRVLSQAFHEIGARVIASPTCLDQ